MSELPAKLYFRIGEVAGLVGVEPHVLRYWEREFRSIRPQKSTKGQRIYSRKDVENLLRVRDLLYRDGFTIAGAKKRMKRGPEALDLAAPPDTDPDVAALDRQSERERESDAPASTARALQGSVREKLLSLRGEVEAFLEELSAVDGEHDARAEAQGRRRG